MVEPDTEGQGVSCGLPVGLRRSTRHPWIQVGQPTLTEYELLLSLPFPRKTSVPASTLVRYALLASSLRWTRASAMAVMSVVAELVLATRT